MPNHSALRRKRRQKAPPFAAVVAPSPALGTNQVVNHVDEFTRLLRHGRR
jgi:hypothetical protein